MRKIMSFLVAFMLAVTPALADQDLIGNIYLDATRSAPTLATDADGKIVEGAEYITDAPSDGNQYARQNTNWAVITPPITGVNWGRDLPEPDLVADIRNVVAGDPSPDGQGELAIERGIEIGHVFYLGTKYSKAMNATFLGEDGKPQFMEMGCYGIGITRLPAAAIEQNHDERGIIWPDAIAPFTVVICPVNMDRSEAVKAEAHRLYQALVDAGVDVILDDRGERPGAMFADWELIGVPHRVTVGERALKDAQVEYQHRRDTEARRLALDEVVPYLTAALKPGR